VTDRVSTVDLEDGETVALAVGLGGMLALVFGWMLGSGVLRFFGLAAAIAGGGVYARGKLAKRHEKIEAAESHIRSELDELDPVARAEVLKGLTRPES
jgi:hypothetical protein